MSEILKFMKRNRLFFHANAIWQHDPRLKVSTIVFPQNHRLRLWEKRAPPKGLKLRR